MLKLSEDQQKILEVLMRWYINASKKIPYLTLGGYAGTGKTTLISYFKKELKREVKTISIAFCSYTGKASRVLESKLQEQKALGPKDFTGTIHSLIYSPLTNSKEEIIGWDIKTDLEYDLIVVDESSMLDQKIWNDLLSFKIPILAVGDHGQLPPIKGSFNLMEKPMLKLEKIHRQAENNPIIKLSATIRRTGHVKPGEYGPNITKLNRQDPTTGEIVEELLQNYNDNTLILCGYNNTRIKLNKYIKNTQNPDTDLPESGDKVICLRNNHTKRIYNGMQGTIKNIYEDDKKWYYSSIVMDDSTLFKGLILKEQFNNAKSFNFTNNRHLTKKGDLFDYGYALTVHKAQGSQAYRVVVFEERFSKMTNDLWKKWLYTAVTRAETELFIIG